MQRLKDYALLKSYFFAASKKKEMFLIKII